MNTDTCIYHLQRKNNPRRLSAISFPYLGKLGTTTNSQIQECKHQLAKLLTHSAQHKEISKTPLIVGLAESGILPSALMHQIAIEHGLNAYWICSTRRKAGGIRFFESHSHAPHHVLPWPDCQPTELWFVEDEVTTGKTVFHLAVELCRLLSIRQIRLFTLADSRTPAEISQFQSALNGHGITCLTEVFVQVSKLSCQSDCLADMSQTLDLKTIQQTENQCTTPFSIDQRSNDWCLPNLRPSLQAQKESVMPISNKLTGCLLVVGEAIDLAVKLIQINPLLSFQQITLSPWQIDHRSIQSCLEIGDRYYLYNYENLPRPIYLLSDPIDFTTTQSAQQILQEKGFVVEHLQLSAHWPISLEPA